MDKQKAKKRNRVNEDESDADLDTSNGDIEPVEPLSEEENLEGEPLEEEVEEEFIDLEADPKTSQEVMRTCQFCSTEDKESNMELTENGFWQHKVRCQESEPAFTASSASSNTNSSHSTTKESSSNKSKTKKRRISIGLTGSQAVDTTSVDTSLDLHQRETSNTSVSQMEIDTGKASSSSVAETQRAITSLRQQTQNAQKEKEKSRKELSDANEAAYSKYIKEFVRLMKKIDSSYQTQIENQRKLNETYLQVLKKIEDKLDKIL